MRRVRFSLCARTLALATLVVAALAQPALALITYVDATDGPSGNTTLLDGSEWTITATATGPVDNIWSRRVFSNGGSIYEASIQTPFTTGGPTEDAHMLRTTITGLTPGSSYNVYGYFWSSGTTGDWRLEGTINPADINNNGTPANPLDDSLPAQPGVSFTRMAGNPNATQAPAAIPARFDSTLLFEEGGRTLYEAPFGTAVANGSGEIDVFIDDWENPLNIRTWYDGVGFEEVGLPTLTINRETGEMIYTSNTPRNIAGYSIQSAVGALTQDDWKSITEFYDATATGTQAGFIDNNDSWVKLSNPASVTDLSEAELNLTGPQDGGVLPGNTPISFGTGWTQYFTEDVRMDLLLNDAEGTVEPVNVVFVGNNDLAFARGDFNFNGSVGPEDFAIFIDSLFAPISGSVVQAYAQGDLTGDIMVDHDDLVAYRDIYNAANGAGAFQALMSGQVAVPEPGTALLMMVAGTLLAGWVCIRSGRLRRCAVATSSRRVRTVAIATTLLGLAASSQAQIVYVDAVPNNVDATVNPNPNTTLLGGSPWGATTAAAADNLYRLRTSTAWGNAGIYESNVSGAENAPILVTTVGGLMPNTRYLTYGLFWSNPAENWRLKITHDPTDINDNGTPGDPLDDFLPDTPGISFSGNGSPTSTDAPLAAAIEFAGPVVIGTNPVLHKAELGINSTDANGQLVFYVDDLAAQTSAVNRTWYDGVGYQRVLDLTLQVNTTTGVATLKNLSGDDIDLSYYKITSENQMNEEGWITLDMQNFGATDGADPGNVAGDSQLEGWDMAGGSDTSLLSEVNFLGTSVLPADFSITLGQAFAPGTTSGVTFEFETPFQGVMQGIIEYVTSVPLAGDYDGNGTVEGADYTLWKLQYGQAGSGIASDGNGDGVVDASDYNVWRNNFGNTAGGLAMTAATVPEPTSLGCVALVALVGCWLCRRRGTSLHRALVLVPAMLVLSLATAGAAVSIDRNYTLGDDSLEVASDNQPVGGNNTAPLASGNSADSQGPTGAYLDLESGGAPTYVAVGSLGGGRPLAAPGSHGVRFNGTSDYLSGIPLNRPDELALILATANNPSTYPLNYNGITRRGMQMWVYPDQAGIDAGNFQSIVSDSILAGGPAISADGQWSQMTSRHFANIATGPETTTDVVGNTWYHVMQHISIDGDAGAPRSVAGSGAINPFNSVVYVNGIAVSANNDSMDFTRTYQTGPPVVVTGNPQPDYDHRLVVGGSELPNPDTGGPTLYGNFFDGVVDDLEMYVYGNNSAEGGQNWGSFDLFEDNAWIKNKIDTDPLLQGNLEPGDVNRDGQINQADVTAFIGGWLSRKEFQGAHSRLTAGDWETWTWGDMDHDGVVYLNDLSIMHKALAAAGLGGFDVSLLAGAGTQVPEPATVTLLAGLATLALASRRRRS